VQRKGAGSIQQLAELHTAAVGGDVGTAEVVAQQVVGLPAAAHGDAHAAGVVVLSDCAAVVALVDGTHIDGGRRAEGGFDLVIPWAMLKAGSSVIEEHYCDRAADRHIRHPAEDRIR